MSFYDLPALNQTFGLPGQLRFTETGDGQAVAEIANTHAEATLHLQGAQLTGWTPRGQAPVIWLSPKAVFAPGKAIRGGVPVCWPWFGDRAGGPAHGYARTSPWEVAASAQAEDGATCLVLRLPAQPALWPHETPVEIRLSVGATLEIELATRNLGAEAVVLSQALHTYFQVADVRRIALEGLDGRDYFDKLDGQRKRQAGAVVFDGEVDRVYRDEGGDCVIDDPGLGRRIRIAKQGSASTVVWNPWTDKGRQLGDLGEDGHLGMVCVETANAGEDAVTLAPGAAHRLKAAYRVEARPA
jgi:glucose-6-phosphate 1-epimerase